MNTALLLLGPTGSGKTPLGDALQREGLWGRRCHHFDFGEQLRKAADGAAGVDLVEADIALVRGVLDRRVLLENETFRIAERIWDGFLATHDVGADDLVVLNGLPRHVDQARDVDRLADITVVVRLACSADVVRRRIRLNAGGDRAGRVDDDAAAVERKMLLYEERTLPLVEHYRDRGAEIRTIPIAMDTDPYAILRALTEDGPPSRTGT